MWRYKLLIDNGITHHALRVCCETDGTVLNLRIPIVRALDRPLDIHFLRKSNEPIATDDDTMREGRFRLRSWTAF
jgi:hypothetical protein